MPLPRHYRHWRKKLERLQQRAVEERLAPTHMASALRHSRTTSPYRNGGGDIRPECHHCRGVVCPQRKKPRHHPSETRMLTKSTAASQRPRSRLLLLEHARRHRLHRLSYGVDLPRTPQGHPQDIHLPLVRLPRSDARLRSTKTTRWSLRQNRSSPTPTLSSSPH